MMNDNDDYLWDKTGEPDSEIQELEQVLGTLRYQPRALEIPAGIAPSRKRVLVPHFLAIAATIAIMLLGAGLWLSLHRRTGERLEVATKPVTTDGGRQSAGAAPKTSKDPPVPLPTTTPGDKPVLHRVNHEVLSHQFANNRRPRVNPPALDAKERNEALAAKEQLMLALRVASSKLSFAQRKAQEINSENLIHNQHKIG